MNKRPLEKQFGKYVAASMVTMLLTGFYAIIDGFFVGQATGDAGLAAINIAWPITALIMATGVGIGAGGAVLMSMRMGEHNERLAALTRSNTLLSLAGASVSVSYTHLDVYKRQSSKLSVSSDSRPKIRTISRAKSPRLIPRFGLKVVSEVPNTISLYAR